MECHRVHFVAIHLDLKARCCHLLHLQSPLEAGEATLVNFVHIELDVGHFFKGLREGDVHCGCAMMAMPKIFLELSFHPPVRHVHYILPFFRATQALRSKAHLRRHGILRQGHNGKVLLWPHHEVLGDCDPLHKIERTRQHSFAENIHRLHILMPRCSSTNIKRSKGRESVEPTETTCGADLNAKGIQPSVGPGRCSSGKAGGVSAVHPGHRSVVTVEPAHVVLVYRGQDGGSFSERACKLDGVY